MATLSWKSSHPSRRHGVVSNWCNKYRWLPSLMHVLPDVPIPFKFSRYREFTPFMQYWILHNFKEQFELNQCQVMIISISPFFRRFMADVSYPSIFLRGLIWGTTSSVVSKVSFRPIAFVPATKPDGPIIFPRSSAFLQISLNKCILEFFPNLFVSNSACGYRCLSAESEVCNFAYRSKFQIFECYKMLRIERFEGRVPLYCTLSCFFRL